VKVSKSKGRASRILSLGVHGGRRGSDDAAMGELEMELALLREENARLKVERHRPPDAGRVIERMRHLERVGDPRGDDQAPRGDAAETTAECTAMRNGLLEACREVQHAMQSIRARLSALAVDDEFVPEERASAPVLSAPTVSEERDLELAVGAPVPPGISQSLA
jgi:hypothetical protein